jgi:flagellar hook-associated protein 3 FlgL
MRISTANTFNASIDNLQTRQAELSQMQQKLTSGKRVERASDDPTAAARAERALASIGRSDADQRALEASRTAMTLSESALSDAGDLLQQARESLVAAGNASYSDSERAGLATQLQSLRDQLMAVANRKDANGNYLFGGQGVTQMPFLDAAGGVTYRGADGQQMVAGDEPLPTTVDGRMAWMQARTGNGVFETRAADASVAAGAWIDSGSVTDPSRIDATAQQYDIGFDSTGSNYTVTKTDASGSTSTVASGAYLSGQAIEVDGMSFTITGTATSSDHFQVLPSTPSLNVFQVLDTAIAQLKQTGRTEAQTTQTVQSSLAGLDAGMGRLQLTRAQVGQTLSRTDAVESRVAQSKLASQTEKSNAEDIDEVQAISEFQNRQTGYDAALKMYSIVQKMSLFDYING